MSTLIRSDGIQFVINAYRETVSAQRRSLLLQKLRLLTEQQGRYLTVFQKNADSFEIVLSKEPGFLLGETIRQHFKDDLNFVFCELIPEQTDIILVIVRDGSIIVDSKVEVVELYDELLPFLVTENPYHFYVSPELPLTLEENDPTKIRLPKQSVSALTPLAEPVFPNLKPAPEFQLTDIANAMKYAKFKRGPEIAVLWALGALLIVGIVWWFLKPSDNPQPQHPTAPVVQAVSSYNTYLSALSTPDPGQVLVRSERVLENLFFAPGWDLATLSFDGRKYIATYASTSGNVELLGQWAAKNNYGFQLNADGAQVTVLSNVPPRSAPTFVYDESQVTELLLDQFVSIVGQSAVTLGNQTIDGKLKQRTMTIQFNGVSPQFLGLMAGELQGLPVQLNSLQLTINNGLISGSLTIAIWGT